MIDQATDLTSPVDNPKKKKTSNSSIIRSEISGSAEKHHFNEVCCQLKTDSISQVAKMMVGKPQTNQMSFSCPVNSLSITGTCRSLVLKKDNSMQVGLFKI